MQKLQPKMQEIRDKYKDDPQRQQQETMKLYQEAKFNPLSGCLPMILQMPIFIALYQVLLELPTRNTGSDTTMSFYGIIPDLTVSPNTVFTDQGVFAVIPYVVMMLLFAASLLIPMLLQQTGDKNTRVMMIVMSVVMLWFGWSIPAGVLLYWDVSSYLGVGQQFFSRKLLMRKEEQAAADVVDIAPTKVDVERAERKARPKKKR
jgi:YidC/Oxa1 family membrane protein insertase